MQEPEGLSPLRGPFAEIRRRIGSQAGIDVELLPRGWERIGEVVVLRIPRKLARWREEIATAYGDVLRAKTVVEDLAKIHGPWRIPEVRWIRGNGTETVHSEGRVRFKLDVAATMFSSGNMEERKRMSRITRPGETVVDLFAGIGYFSLPIAAHANPRKIFACEINPVAYRYLLENIRLNRAGTVEARLGDCRETAPKGAADRVILGHFDAERYLDTAFEAAKDRAVLHIHGLRHWRESEPRTRAREGARLSGSLEDSAASHGFDVRSVEDRVVKWYGPHRLHYVLDVAVERR